MEMVTQSRKIKLNFLRVIVKNIPSIPLFEGVEN